MQLFQGVGDSLVALDLQAMAKGPKSQSSRHTFCTRVQDGDVWDGGIPIYDSRLEAATFGGRCWSWGK